MRQVLLCIAVVAACSSATLQAMEIELAGDTLYLHGRAISDDDWVRYRELVQGKRFSTAVIGNQGGGAVGTALGIAEDLIRRRVRTVAFGYCRSACTYIFLAGETRQIAAGWPTSRIQFGFHGTYHRFFGTPALQGNHVAAYYRSRLPEASWEIIGRALSGLPDRRGFLYSYHPAHRDDASLCSGSLEEKCERVPGGNVLALGVLTTADAAQVPLPERLAAKETLLGIDARELETITAASAIADLCPAKGVPGCVASARRFFERPPERAWALAASGIAGSSWRANDPRRAAWRALYECVRRANALCQVAAVNNHLTSTIYDLWREESEDAIRVLRAMPAEKHPAERYEQTELPMAGFRTDTFRGTTPENIPGVTEVMTRDVAAMLVEASSVLVDVGCAEATLPTAHCIFGGGLAFARRERDGEHGRLFSILIDAVSRGKPIVLFAADSRSWLSANAALRAAKTGRTAYWYRGGLAAWKNAGLPTVPTAAVGATVE